MVLCLYAPAERNTEQIKLKEFGDNVTQCLKLLFLMLDLRLLQ
jgi:hypothetical protein